MANVVICAELNGGHDFSCTRNFAKKYFQEAVFINLHDIDRTASGEPDIGGGGDAGACVYNIPMVLKEGRQGFAFRLPDNGNAIKGFYAKSRDDNGRNQYLHQVQFMLMGASEDIKCTLDKLDQGRYVVALQLTDGTVEIYGWFNGLSTGDYTYDIAEGGGGGVLVLQSDENAQEPTLPLIYRSGIDQGENADFNDQFAQP